MKRPKHEPNDSYFYLERQLFKVHDESLCPQLGKLTCKNGNDCYKTDSNLTCLFYGREIIKRVPN